LIEFKPDDGKPLLQDFEILITLENPFQTSVRVQNIPSINKNAVMLSYFPDLSEG